MGIDKIGKFKVLATLGAGAHSSILHVRRDDDGKEYALKVVSIDGDEEKKFLEQAEHELRVSHMLNHPNLVKVHLLELEKGGLFGLGGVKKARLLVEYVKGETLDQAKLIKPARLLRIFQQIAAGLAHMHQKGVLHADMKPNNVMVGRGHVVKILDYGLAWIKGVPKDRVQGTPEYMAPETATHKMVSERTDLYNFGATMYRLTTFQLPPSVIPAEGMKIKEAQFRNLLKPVRELAPNTPPKLAELIEQCLQFDAHKRPNGMTDVHNALDALADEAEAKLSPDELDG
jgi:eukaryotic-like serine/threonine-protein kinase